MPAAAGAPLFANERSKILRLNRNRSADVQPPSAIFSYRRWRARRPHHIDEALSFQSKIVNYNQKSRI